MSDSIRRGVARWVGLSRSGFEMAKHIILAALIPLIALALQWTFWHEISPFVWFLFFPAVFFSARFNGFWCGILSTLISTAICLVLLYSPPQLSWEIANPNNMYSVVSFLIMGYFFSESQARLARAKLTAKSFLSETKEANEKITVLYKKP